VSTLIAQYGLIIVALIIFAGEIGLPTLVPGEIALLIAGNQVIHSVPMLLGVIVLFAAVDLVATSSIHTASRTGGNRLLSCLLRMTCRKGTRPEALLEDCRRRLGGHDSVVVFVTRLIPVFRLYASIGTGLIRIRFRDFLAGAAPAALVWAAMPLTVGYVLRSQVGGMVAQYPAMMRYIVIASAGATVILCCIGWLRHAGGRAAALRRVRFILGVLAVGGATARTLSLAFQEHGLAGHRLSIPFTPVFYVGVTLIGLMGFGLLWVAGHDLKIICTRHRRAGFGKISGLAWVSLAALLALATTGVGPSIASPPI
jgi:membrane protein DedA with SNARE-associated domain